MEKILEAILFSAPESLKIEEICKIVKASKEEVEKALDMLARKYSEMDSAIEIVKLEDRYLMRVKAEYVQYVEKFLEKEFDKGTLRTLAVIALKQPITLSRLAKIRGNKCYDHVKKLIEMKFVRAEKKGRSTILTTTDAFAEYFGFDAKDSEKLKEALKKLSTLENLS